MNVVKKNTIRLAEVWMDGYKNYYYERFNFDLVSLILKRLRVIEWVLIYLTF